MSLKITAEPGREYPIVFVDENYPKGQKIFPVCEAERIRDEAVAAIAAAEGVAWPHFSKFRLSPVPPLGIKIPKPDEIQRGKIEDVQPGGEVQELKPGEFRYLVDGEACGLHVGCLAHVTHPCEGCGRVGGYEVDEAKFAKFVDDPRFPHTLAHRFAAIHKAARDLQSTVTRELRQAAGLLHGMHEKAKDDELLKMDQHDAFKSCSGQFLAEIKARTEEHRLKAASADQDGEREHSGIATALEDLGEWLEELAEDGS